MLRMLCHSEGVCGDLDASELPLTEYVQQTLKYWHEESGPQLFWWVDATGNHLATAMRGEGDPNLAVVTYANGTLEVYRCVYHLDAEGMYDHTTVERVK